MKTSSTIETTGYLSQDDESEAERLESLRQDRSGVGEPIYYDDEDIKDYALKDFGFMPKGILPR